MRKSTLTMVACIGILTACHFGRDIYDDFEAASLSRIWQTKKHIPGAVEIQSMVVRSGQRAAKIMLRPGDQIDKERGTNLERAELLEKERLWAHEDRKYLYAFSIFLPHDFPIVPTRLVIAQWKQECPFESCEPDNPVIAVRYIGGELLITHKVSQRGTVLYRTTDDIRNQWLDFQFEIRFADSSDGVIRIWLNDEMVVDYTGRNAYPPTGGYPDDNLFYFKMGMYRDRVEQSMTLYVDEYRKQLMPDTG